MHTSSKVVEAIMGVHQDLPGAGVATEPLPRENSAYIDPEHVSGMENLLMYEAEVRKCQSLRQLQFLIANDTSKLIPAQQTIVMTGHERLKISTVSSLASLNNTSPTLRWLENSLNQAAAGIENNDGDNVSTCTLDGASAPETFWPFCQVLQIELPLRKNGVCTRVALLSTNKYTTTNVAMAERLAITNAHAWDALSKTGLSFSRLLSKKLAISASLIVIMALFIPVKMTVLAPAEIVARNPEIVAAPLNGVVASIEVIPNEHVTAGQLLFTYTPTDLNNELTIASQNVAVAKSRYRRASQDAFNANNGRRQMAELKTELELAMAKLSYANSRLELSRVRAKSDGVVLFSDKDDWVGKPVVTGEKIMNIADPSVTDFKIKLAVNDSVMLQNGNNARIFLDTDPLNPVAANIVRKSYHAKIDESNIVSYEIYAQQIDGTRAFNHRIGVRGTAQLYGKKVPLGLFLFRKPLSAFRQYTGF